MQEPQTAATSVSIQTSSVYALVKDFSRFESLKGFGMLASEEFGPPKVQGGWKPILQLAGEPTMSSTIFFLTFMADDPWS